jgi:hypothetical protein
MLPMNDPALVRKTVSLPVPLWLAIKSYKAAEGTLTDAEAIRRLLQMGLRQALMAPNAE